MTKAEAIEKINELDNYLRKASDCGAVSYEKFLITMDYIRTFIQSLPDVVQCKDCEKYNPNLKFCNYWDCTMYENAYCDQGERKDGKQ